MAKTTAERKRDERARKRKDGWKEKSYWIKPEWDALIKDLINSLRSK